MPWTRVVFRGTVVADVAGEMEGARGSISGEASDLAPYELIARGHEDGTIAPRITPLWAQHLLWSTLHSGRHHTDVARAAVFEAHDTCPLSLVEAVGCG